MKCNLKMYWICFYQYKEQNYSKSSFTKHLIYQNELPRHGANPLLETTYTVRITQTGQHILIHMV